MLSGLWAIFGYFFVSFVYFLSFFLFECSSTFGPWWAFSETFSSSFSPYFLASDPFCLGFLWWIEVVGFFYAWGDLSWLVFAVPGRLEPAPKARFFELGVSGHKSRSTFFIDDGSFLVRFFHSVSIFWSYPFLFAAHAIQFFCLLLFFLLMFFIFFLQLFSFISRLWASMHRCFWLHWVYRIVTWFVWRNSAGSRLDDRDFAQSFFNFLVLVF